MNTSVTSSRPCSPLNQEPQTEMPILNAAFSQIEHKKARRKKLNNTQQENEVIFYCNKNESQ